MGCTANMWPLEQLFGGLGAWLDCGRKDEAIIDKVLNYLPAGEYVA